MAENKQALRSYDPHGYWPVLVDEDCLTGEESMEALMAPMSTIADPLRSNDRANWRSALTPEELKKVKEIEEAPRRREAFYIGGYVHAEKEEKVFEFARVGGQRAYARNKYADGEKFWYGDVVPWLQTDG